MKAAVTTLAAVLAITLGTAATQATQTPVTQTTPATQATDPQKQMPPEVTLTGCVIQGSSPTVFLLSNAKKDPASATEKGVQYLLASTVEDVDLRTHLNHEVRIVGEVDAKVSADPVTVPPVPPVPPAPTDPEKSLPKLKAKSVTMVSDTCALVR
jgi:hypothetical protein